ncbi:hypothetical protein QBC46DRAFT_396970 [Diplogelasinospora grovesii]|uniref:Glycosyl transferase family 25 domain-containing protein n=1 Tax=Diplogelasinospora grovesii TaxID=303347 RepID=A0AAN6MY49_9PEZI|nr:hypothetical protein QBC46DRAFT_396970 [Diplogelasinospora grovesii]
MFDQKLSAMFSRRTLHPVVIALGFVSVLCLIYLQSGHHGSLGSVGYPSRSSPHDLIDDINNSTLGFQKIFVVGLPQRTDRRDRMILEASLTGLEIEFIDGVLGKDIVNKSIPMGPNKERMGDPVLGCWRGHMNAIQQIIQRNITSALILEDDVDFDVRIRKLMRNFAMGVRTLTQPLTSSLGSFADPSFPLPREQSSQSDPFTEISFDNLPSTVPPRVSPYGDNWDQLWLGHCGQRFPDGKNKLIPRGRVIHTGDLSVPQPRHLWSWPQPFELVERYPEHTRVIHHSQEGVCTLGYAVTQKAARQILYEIGLKEVRSAIDIMLRWFCEGSEGMAYHRCLTSQPGLFHHHRPRGPVSAGTDIGDHGDGFREKALTDMTRWSVMLNADILLEGRTDFVDQFPDTQDQA